MARSALPPPDDASGYTRARPAGRPAVPTAAQPAPAAGSKEAQPAVDQPAAPVPAGAGSAGLGGPAQTTQAATR